MNDIDNIHSLPIGVNWAPKKTTKLCPSVEISKVLIDNESH